MKNLYALILGLGICTTAFSQDIIVDTFENMTVGPVSTNVNGTTLGPGGHYTLAPTGTPNNDFLILNIGGTRGKVLQIIGGVSADRYVWKQGFPAAWSAREQGNNIIEVSYEFLTGVATTSKNTVGVALFDESTEQIIAGLQFHLDTKEIVGLGRYQVNGVETNYTFKLGQVAGTAMTLPSSNWVKVGFSYDKTTGMLRFKGPGFNKFIMGAAIGVDPNELDYFVSYEPDNALSGQGRFNDILAKAVATDGLLDVTTPATSAEFAIYPNPVNDYMYLRSITGVQLQKAVAYDLVGRVVGQWQFSQQEEQALDLAYLKAGHYILHLQAENGSLQHAFIKN